MKAYLSLIKFAHTVFALPFAFLSFFLAVRIEGSKTNWRLFFLVLLCMIFARSAAMAFNRYVDRDIDARNQRTSVREIPSGKISATSALMMVLLMSAAFVLTTWLINRHVLYLSPIALTVVLGYSYSKRFTWLCHFILGIALGFAPLGAYIAVTGHFHPLPVLYGIMVMLWVAGFDILYALQDETFDKEQGLFSIPARFGLETAKKIAMGVHFLCALLLLYITWYQGQLIPSLHLIHWLGATGFIGLLIWQHRLVTQYGLEKINQAFFETNGMASVLFGAAVILDVLT